MTLWSTSYINNLQLIDTFYVLCKGILEIRLKGHQVWMKTGYLLHNPWSWYICWQSSWVSIERRRDRNFNINKKCQTILPQNYLLLTKKLGSLLEWLLKRSLTPCKKSPDHLRLPALVYQRQLQSVPGINPVTTYFNFKGDRIAL